MVIAHALRDSAQFGIEKTCMSSSYLRNERLYINEALTATKSGSLLFGVRDQFSFILVVE